MLPKHSTSVIKSEPRFVRLQLTRYSNHFKDLKKLLTLFLFVASSFAAFSQVNFGMKTGGNISRVIFAKKYTELYESRIGFYAGLYTNVKLSDKISLQAEALYSMKGSKFSTDVVSFSDYELNLDYISIPLLCNYKIGTKLSLAMGPQVSFLVSEKYNGYFPHIRRYSKKDFGMVADLSYRICKGVGVAIRYDCGFKKITKAYELGSSDPVPAGNNRTIQFGIFYQMKKD